MPCQANFFFAEICFFFVDNRRHASTHWHSSNFPFSSCTPLSVSIAVLYSVLASAKPLNRWICYSGRTSWIVFHSHHYIKQQAPSSRAVFSPDGRFHFVLFLSFIFITVQFRLRVQSSADIPAYGNMYSVLSFFCISCCGKESQVRSICWISARPHKKAGGDRRKTRPSLRSPSAQHIQLRCGRITIKQHRLDAVERRIFDVICQASGASEPYRLYTNKPALA